MEKNKKKNPQADKNQSLLELLQAHGIPAKNTTSEYAGQSVIVCMGSRGEENFKKTK